ncbi:hypothetical protein QBC32DRAFT_158660 [Pseudoneurospora amorphoporcata]|uniref:HTH CENPB-type domain-containing protein n=1 Tax=Pseudoneurospora amorphoporcata TaxID=241081 RepID=A0AAN6NMS1_9PEZI|nr:hypothetical protein QBC32DRAFT_158660 [Pseudoneurospora amorphoporcata]
MPLDYSLLNLSGVKGAEIYHHGRHRRRPPSIRQVAARTGESRSSIARHAKSLQETGQPAISSRSRGRPRMLTNAEEDAIVAYVVFCFEGRFPAMCEMVIGAANRLRELRGAPANCDSRWLTRFLKDHPELKITTYRAVDLRRRFWELNEESVDDWFNQYQGLLKDHNVDRADVWNCDEMGVRIDCVAGGRVKMVVLRDLAR